MLDPAKIDLTVFIGGQFDTKLIFWKDSKNTDPFELEEYDIEFDIHGGATLKPGDGLTVINNEIAVLMTPTQTSEHAPLARTGYHIKLSKEGEVLYPIKGLISFESP